MATVSFLYRSKKNKAPLTLRLRFTSDKEYSLDINSKIEVLKNYWDEIHPKANIRNAVQKSAQIDCKNELYKLESFILESFNKTLIQKINKAWLKETFQLYLNPEVEQTIPLRILEYIDFYLDYRKSEISIANRKKYVTIKNKLADIEKYLKKEITFDMVNESFRKKLGEYYFQKGYAQNTLQREFVSIKTLCKHAHGLGVHTNTYFQSLSFKREKIENVIFLTKDELNAISTYKFSFENDYLDTARDWLLISCYTGQRISDFMRFTSGMISEVEEGKKIISIVQKKTSKEVLIPISKKLEIILNKRNGDFPNQMIEQVYNRHVKAVGELVGLNEVVMGKLTIPMEKGSRRQLCEDFKFKFITSHIGRRTFATHYYGRMPLNHLKEITGHATETMLITYLGKKPVDNAILAHEFIDL